MLRQSYNLWLCLPSDTDTLADKTMLVALTSNSENAQHMSTSGNLCSAIPCQFRTGRFTLSQFTAESSPDNRLYVQNDTTRPCTDEISDGKATHRRR